MLIGATESDPFLQYILICGDIQDKSITFVGDFGVALQEAFYSMLNALQCRAEYLNKISPRKSY